jgi:hypothetical protein
MFVARARPTPDFHEVKRLTKLGLSDYRIARETGIPRSTIRRWRVRDCAPRPPRTCPPDWRPPNGKAYAYLLGLFLGDGCLFLRPTRSHQLVLTLDSSYPRIIYEARMAICETVPGVSVPHSDRQGCIALRASDPAWSYAFPQGLAPGRKHTRAIELLPWQRELTDAHARSFLRGLIHSDGCRSINRFRTKLPSGRVAEYEYVRYFFTNYSADIRRIFCDHCNLLGIRWTQSSFKNISVAHRDSVARLDEFVGPKA